jgi:hypothetical protein
MNAILGTMTALAVPLGFLNAFGGIVAGIWLAVLGNWGAIGWGIAAILLSTFGISLALLPGMALAAPAAYFAEWGYKLPFHFFALLSSLYTVAVIALWCGIVLYFFASQADSSSVIPLLLWSYGVATGPFAYMASKEGDDAFASIAATFFAQVGYVVMVLLVLFFRVTLIDVLTVFLLIMLAGVAVQFSVAIKLQRKGAF